MEATRQDAFRYIAGMYQVVAHENGQVLKYCFHHARGEGIVLWTGDWQDLGIEYRVSAFGLHGLFNSHYYGPYTYEAELRALEDFKNRA